MEWLKKHADTVVIMAGIIGSLLWMNSQINGLKQDVLVIKTVLILKGILPPTLVTSEPPK